MNEKEEFQSFNLLTTCIHVLSYADCSNSKIIGAVLSVCNSLAKPVTGLRDPLPPDARLPVIIGHDLPSERNR